MMMDEEASCTNHGAAHLTRRGSRLFAACVLVVVSLCFAANPARSQSTLADAPTPLTEKVVEGRIAPRDIGDSRTTTYFFTFDTVQGDLEFNVTTENLDGDIDLYELGSLQPLTKVTLLATGSASEVRRTIFMREAAPLLLRVQARSSGDTVGTYRISFDGAFLPSTRAIIAANDDAKQSDEISENTIPTNRSTQRVNAVGGRIEEPVEPARAPSLPDLNTAPDDANEPRETIVVPRAARRAPRRRESASARRRAPRPPRPARRTPPPAPVVEPEETIDSASETSPPPTPPPANSPSTTPTPSTTRRRANTPARTRPPAAPRPARAARLIIRTRDGARTERSMSEVERVTIEGGELIVVLKNGETQKLDLSDVLRFTVEP